jgi:hypothetical protein
MGAFNNLPPFKQNSVCFKCKPLNIEKVTRKYFSDEIVRYSKEGKNSYFHIETSEKQKVLVSFTRFKYTEDIRMELIFQYDGYYSDYQCDIFTGWDHELLQTCFENFKIIIELWITEVVCKFNESLGLENTFITKTL